MARVTSRAVHVIVRGHVQGVGFRWFVCETARSLRLGGWVRNRSDGTVEAMAVGESGSVERFLSALRAGPPRADVLELQVRDAGAAHADGTTFEIRH